MKKLNFISIILLFLSVSVFGQITKVDSVNVIPSNVREVLMPVNKIELGSGNQWNLSEMRMDIIYANSVERFYIYNVKDSILTFYNSDCSIYKSLKLSLSGYELNYHPSPIKYVTTNMFNNDDLIEFVCCFVNRTQNKYVTLVLNENNQVLYNFKDENLKYVYATSTGQLKLNTQKYVTNSTNNNYSTNIIYSLGTSTPSGISPLSLAPAERNPFPNPAKQTIQLPYQLEQGKQANMKIFDVNGKQVTTKQIDATFDKILLDVSSYQKGMYVYEVNGKRGKFLVE